MALTLNDGFLVLFIVLLIALGISNFVETKNEQDQTLGRPFFAIIFIVLALGIAAYKISSR
jgi:uncharacterized membrane protein YidH (DUF202 family)